MVISQPKMLTMSVALDNHMHVIVKLMQVAFWLLKPPKGTGQTIQGRTAQSRDQPALQGALV
jgi:hypothetical protein